MARRAWLLILGAGLCATALPGCAPLNGLLRNNSSISSDTPEAQANAGNQQRREHPPGLEESEPPVAPPRLPTHATAVGRDAPPIPDTTDPAGQMLPSGYDVAQYQPPPPVLPPLNVSLQRIANQMSAPGSGPVPELAIPQNQQINVLLTPSQDTQEEVVRALHYLLNNQPDEALDHLRHFDEATKPIVMRLLSALATLNEKRADQLNASETSALEAGIQGLLADLRGRAALTIDTMCLAEKIEGFGKYLPKRAGNVVQPGEFVQVYLELRNIAGEFNGSYFIYRLNGTVRIHNAEGEVYSYNFRNDDGPRLSRIPQYDCFLPYTVKIPASLPCGKYTLTMEIVDETRLPHRTAHKSMEITVGPSGSR